MFYERERESRPSKKVPVATYSAAGPQSCKMGAIENTIEVANGQVPRHDLAQVEIRNVRRHGGDCGLGRLVGPKAVGLLNAPRGLSDDPHWHISESAVSHCRQRYE